MIEGEAHVASLDAAHELRTEDPSRVPPLENPQARKMTLNMGPQHPSTHGVLRVLIELDGETILNARPEIGYLHTGIEKEFEVKKYQQGKPQTNQNKKQTNQKNNHRKTQTKERLL